MLNICRLCVQTDSKKYYCMDTDDYRQKLKSVIPEIDIDIVEQPLICEKCSILLISAYTFKINSLQTDEELKIYANIDGKKLKLEDFLRRKNDDSLTSVKIEIAESQLVNFSLNQTQPNLNQDAKCEEDTHEIKVIETSIQNTNERPTNENVSVNGTTPKQKIINKCELCKKVFLRKSGFEKHLRSYEHYKCTICNVVTPCKATLEEHMRVHTGERPHQCTYCGKAFSQSSTLSTHVRSVHMSERPFVCEICGMGFPVRGAYTSHKKRRHDPVEKKFVCSHCGKAYLVRSRLQQHMKWHSGVKNYLCQVCSKRFVDNASLKKHLRIHNGEKPYECPVCQKTFSQNHNMKIHQKSCSRRNAQTAK